MRGEGGVDVMREQTDKVEGRAEGGGEPLVPKEYVNVTISTVCHS